MAKVKPPKRSLMESAPKAQPVRAKSADPEILELENWASNALKPKVETTNRKVLKKPVSAGAINAAAEKSTKLAPKASALLTASLQAAKVEYKDHRIMAVGRADKLIMGLRIPFLLQYVLGQSILQLSQFYQVVGEPSSNKSAFGFELVRLFAENGGFGYLIENENKFSPNFANSICGYPDELGTVTNPVDTLGVVPANSLEDWQAKYQYLHRQVRQRMEPAKTKKNRSAGLGRIYPVMFMLDSISGKLSEGKADKIDERGFASRDYAVEAALIQDFLKKIVVDLVGWPFIFVAINHLKKRQKTVGHGIDRQKPGGTHISFQEAIELELTRIKKLRFVDGRVDAASSETGGNRIKIQNKKNSMGQDERAVQVDILWRYDISPADGELRQYTEWDWGGGLVELLTTIESATARKQIRSIVDITPKTDGKTRLYYSKALGIRESSAVTRKDLGQALESREDLLVSLRRVFGIATYGQFIAGTDYLKEIQKRVSSVAKTANKAAEDK